MSNPIPFKQRKAIEALTGIKSSLNQLRSIVALMYSFYRVSGYSSRIRYCIQTSDNKLTIEDNLLEKIENFLCVKDLKQTILRNPLFITQYEALYVGITLLYRLGKITMPGRSATIERTGGNRYPKEIFFAGNMVSLDLILQGFPDDVLKQSLISWLGNKKSANSDFEKRVTSFLSLTTIYTQFKIRTEDDKGLYFQTEGLYSAINSGATDLQIVDAHEYVGPTRIYNNVLKENMDPWLKMASDGTLEFTDTINPTATVISDIITTTLDICNVRIDNNDDNEKVSIDEDSSNVNETVQTIYYGCPGTGKSHEVKSKTEGVADDEGHKDGWKTIWFERQAPYAKVEGPIDEERKKELTNNIFRTTFHPDYDYATFVGCYKPVKNDNNELDYCFVPQVFTNAYIAAYRHKHDPIYLIIEEINRGNCAQIFGDLFQLLDRTNGVSDYPIKPDTELAKYLKSQDVPYEELRLPDNLHIYATMNTSDQSLFPMDSAFKRRWAMEYMPINYEHPKASDFKIIIEKGKENEKEYPWLEFLKMVNEMILDATSSEDKQMGEFFIKSSVSEKEFTNKVMFYLWNDVCKDLYNPRRTAPLYFLRTANPENGSKDIFTFADLFGPRNKDSALLKGFIEYLERKYAENHPKAANETEVQQVSAETDTPAETGEDGLTD